LRPSFDTARLPASPAQDEVWEASHFAAGMKLGAAKTYYCGFV